MKKSYLLKTFFLLITSCLLVSCQPPGGDFVPIQLEETRLDSLFDKKNVVQIYDDEQILLKMYGEWKVNGGIFYLTLEVANKSPQNLRIDFNNLILNSTFDKKIDFGNMEAKGENNSGWIKVEDKKVEIKSGETKKFTLGFGMSELKGEYKPQDFYIGNKIFIDLPVRFGEDKEEKIYKFAFKYDNYQ